MLILLLLAGSARADAPGRKKRIAGAVTALAGAVLILAAAGLGNEARTDSDAITQLFAGGGNWTQAARNVDAEGRRDQTAMLVLYPLGGALAIAGITTAVLGWWQDKHHKVNIAPTQGGATASWAVSF